MRTEVIVKSSQIPESQQSAILHALRWRLHRFLTEIAMLKVQFCEEPKPTLANVHLFLIRVKFRKGTILDFDGYVGDFQDVLNDDFLVQSLRRLEKFIERCLIENSQASVKKEYLYLKGDIQW